VTPFEHGWVVGLFSGEGTITTKGAKSIQLSLNMTDEMEVRRFHILIGCGRVYGPYEDSRGHKPRWEWKAQSADNVAQAIGILLPWLDPRRYEQAERVGVLGEALGTIEDLMWDAER
jgi:hypothetical protein